MAGDSSDKTEKPTPKRLREARERGQIARSQDLVTWAGVLAAMVLVELTVKRGATAFADMIEDMRGAIAQADVGAASKYALQSVVTGAVVVAPLLIGLMIVTIVVNLAQVGLKPTTKRLKPDFKRLNPLQGMKRLVQVAAWWEIGKALAKTAVLVAVAWPAVMHMVDAFTAGAGDSLDEIVPLAGETAIVIVRNVAIAGLAIAAADYAWQKRKLTKELSMTRQEVREEYKTQEGNPEIKRAIRSRQQAMSRNRMIGLVGGADVVVVNPTHYAVALKYEAEKGAPQVIAKGADHLAARIRAEAAKHDVPIVSEPMLTRALYKACDVGDLIPIELYEAVAHLLAFVFGLRAKGRAHGHHELPRPVPVPL